MDENSRLLRAYVTERSEQAFAQIISRYWRLVYTTCARELRSDVLAEDAAQVVFIVLAKKASSLRSGAVLSSWLFNTAKFVAKDLRRKETRRMEKEEAMSRYLAEQRDHPADLLEVEPHLNRALNSLPLKERDAIVIRFLQGETLLETGQALGISEDAARMRVKRGLEKLRRHLAARGIEVTAVALAALMLEDTGHAAPSVGTSALAHVIHTMTLPSTTAPLLSPHILKLSKGVIHRMFIHKLAVTAVTGVVIGGTGVMGVGLTKYVNTSKVHVSKGTSSSTLHLAAAAAQPVTDPYTVTFPGNMSIKLIAVSQYTRDWKSQVWWKPDGAPLAVGSYQLNLATPYPPNSQVLIFQRHGMPDNARFKFDVQGTTTSGDNVKLPNGTVAPDLYFLACSNAAHNAIAISVSASNDDWTTFAGANVRELRQSTAVPPADGSIWYFYEPTGDGKLVISASSSVQGQVPVDTTSVRMVAVDDQGKEYVSSSDDWNTQDGNNRWTLFVKCTFTGITISHLSQIHFQSRPYHWMNGTIKNIALSPTRSM